MSNSTNERLFERAYEAKEFCTNSPNHMDEQIEKAIEDNDLQKLEELVSRVESLMSVEEFHNNELL